MEEKIDFNRFDELLEASKEYSEKSKDYIKFIIGLSTGTLVLSTTLARDFFKNPHYNFILIIGWTLLFISIVLGVWILPLGDRFQSLFGSVKRYAKSPDEFMAVNRKELREHYIKTFIKASIPPSIREEKGVQDFFKSMEAQPLENLKKLFRKIADIIGAKDPEAKDFIKELTEEAIKFSSIIKISEDELYLPILIKNTRWAVWQMRCLEKGMRYSFFVGMLAILVFSIINFIK